MPDQIGLAVSAGKFIFAITSHFQIKFSFHNSCLKGLNSRLINILCQASMASGYARRRTLQLGEQVDRSLENKQREAYRVHVLLGAHVSAFRIEPPKSFSLLFSSGHQLTVFDNSERYESFSVGGFYV